MSKFNKSIIIDNSLRKANVTLWAGIVLVILAPFIITQPFLFNWSFFNFHDTGTIGDTIGGITAPVTNLTGAILVYFALKAQIQANRLIQDQINTQKEEEISRKKLQYINEKINIVKNDINAFTYYKIEYSDNGKVNEVHEQYINLVGTDAIEKLIMDYRFSRKHEERKFLIIPKLVEFKNLIDIIELLLNNINNEIISHDDKIFSKSIVGYYYNSKIKSSFTAYKNFINKEIKPCNECGLSHSFLDEVIEVANRIELIIDPSSN